ncbi:hypothetical protein KAX17_00740, partial [Candidatus Bipolaricaulota bacterium]|nr:hypothetical protein [Candidatus Bipolaricaulota bacterium]
HNAETKLRRILGAGLREGQGAKIARLASPVFLDWRQLFFPVNDNYFSRSPIVAQTLPNE